jgi:hypothetical protein
MTGDHAADDAANVPDRLVFTALDFAVGIAAAGAQLRPPMPFPVALRPFLRVQKLTPKAMAAVRRAIEDDPVFRQRLAAVAVPDLLDEAGMLWLQRPEGWVERLAALMPAPDDVDTAAQLRRAEKRRDAAEQAARRAIAELAALRADHERRAETAATAAGATAKVHADLEAARVEGAARERQLGKVTAQLAAATSTIAELESRLAEAEARAADAERVRDQVLATRAGGAGNGEPEVVLERAAALAAELAGHADRAQGMGDELRRLARALAQLEPSRAPQRPAPSPTRTVRRGRPDTQRRPIALPGGVYGSSSEAAEFLVRHAGVVVLVDGYNVAKLGWPSLDLEQQRDQGIRACENVSRRFGTDVVVVFDGASITGAAAAQRRLVRVRFSAEGVTADDVIRAEVAALPAAVPVVVATNDQAVVADVRSMGANTLTSEQLLAIALR